MRNALIGRLRHWLLVQVLALACVPAVTTAKDAPAGLPAARSTVVEFSAWAGPPLRVWYLRPSTAGGDAPVIIVMHGVGRDADRYLAEWVPLARAHGFVVVVPEFSQAAFPGASHYNLGGTFDQDGHAVARRLWAYSAIEPIFDEIVRREGLHASRYMLYGHSAGAQFVHRFAMLAAGPRLARAVAANAGWYAFPDLSISWPYGLGNVVEGRVPLLHALQAPLVVLLGDADTDPRSHHLRRSVEAIAQGAHRFERGKRFYAAAQRAAAENGVALSWSCAIAPGLGHDNAVAAVYAVALLLGEAPTAGADCVMQLPRRPDQQMN